jgi:acyl-CoA thioesterase-1
MMHQPNLSRRSIGIALAGVALVAWVAPARAQNPVSPVAVKAEGIVAAAKVPACNVPLDVARFVHPLAKTAQRLAAAAPLTIVAIGSSSTAGAGATSPANSYPSRLAIELQQRFPTSDIKVINRGVNGEEAGEMLARLETEVLAEKPDLVLWQVGTNALLRNRPLQPALEMINDGIKRMKAVGADVILIDPQFAPKVITKPDHRRMVELISTAAKQGNVDLFSRFAVMRYWRETDGISFDVFLSPDELHMNDWSYACQAKVMGEVIAEAASRNRAIAQTPSRPAVPAMTVSAGR